MARTCPSCLPISTGSRSLGWPPEPENTFVTERWDQALQEIWAGDDAQAALDSAKADIDAHLQDVGVQKS